MKKIHVLTVFAGLTMLFQTGLSSAVELPKYDLGSMSYEGAFRLPHGTFGDTRVVNSSGQIAVDEKSQRFFLTGSDNQSVAEFKLPDTFSKSDKLVELPMAGGPVQNFSNIINRAQTGNPNDVNVLTGMAIIGGKLILNAAVYYDGSGSNQDTTLVVEDPSDLENSEVRGFMQLEGMNHASGWISEIPSEYENVFDGDLAFGHASNLSINGRASMGPSFFSVRQEDLLAAQSGESITSQRVLDFSIDNMLHPDLKNETLENDLWTELSEAYYGVIIPGSSTYLTLGLSGGHESGIGYKITQASGYQCGGYCADDYKDNYNYIWLWAVEDLIASNNGEVEPYEIRPYEWGKIDFPFQNSSDGTFVRSLIIGATVSDSGRLYVVLDKVDGLQSNYSTLPIILVYDLHADQPLPPQSRPSPPESIIVE